MFHCRYGDDRREESDDLIKEILHSASRVVS